jgi:hypothetical protein
VSYEFVQAFAVEIEASGERTKAAPKAKAIRSFIGMIQKVLPIFFIWWRSVPKNPP